MTSVRIFFIGGLMSYRALFTWLRPYELVPTLIVSPICQILLFAYMGRSAGVGTDEFYVIGNALNYAAIPCLFAMGFTVADERYGQTLAIVLTTPARRIPLFLGRALPVIVNGWAVAVVGVVGGVLFLDVSIPASAWPTLLLVLVALVALPACAEDAPPATINDPAFVRRANAVCRERIPALRAPDRKATSTTQLRGSTLDARADALAAVADELDALPIRPADAGRVDAWLADWDRFVEVGHRYADAVAADDQEASSKIDDEAVDLSERIGRFARGNGLDDCVL